MAKPRRLERSKLTPARATASLTAEIKAVDDAIVGDVVGVSQAIGQIQRALRQLDRSLQSRKYETASQIGYETVTSSFVFLQRALGSLQRACSDKEALVSEVARMAGCSCEDALPHLDAEMLSARPLKRKRLG